MMLRNKRAVEVLPVFVLLGMMVGFTVFIMHINSSYAEHDTNPFYGGLGDRELSLIEAYSQIQMDLTSLDIIGAHSLRAAVKEEARTLYLDGCNMRGGVPIVNLDDGCLDGTDILDIVNQSKRSFSSELYSRQVGSHLYFPFNYDIFFIQDGGRFTVQAYAKENVRYPIEPGESDESISPRASSAGMAFDMSKECHYVGDSSRASDVSGFSEEEFECNTGHDFCSGPCPEGLEPKLVPYMNQCNIPECSSGYCNIDYENICNVGCGFKSNQMAYAYYGFEFSELESIHSDNVLMMLDELRSSAPGDIEEVRPGENINQDAEEESVRVVFYDDDSDEVSIAEDIRPQDYDALLEMLDEGLVRLEMSIHDINPRVDDCDGDNDAGYCVKRHFVLAIAGDDDHLIIHDPYTQSRPYRSGMNLVVSKEFIERYWTGHYTHIKGDVA
ncbi:MAG: hypothetical protein ACLFNK_00580 [Candidatus Woesearchaeota archaeon]